MLGTSEFHENEFDINKYKIQCLKLKRDLENFITDLTFKGKGKIFYAVDFSEIFAYLFPNKTANELNLFDIEDKQEVAAIQNQALENLFFSGEGVVLLRPYASEWDTRVTRQLKDEIKKMHPDRYPADIEKEISNLSKDSEVQNLYTKLKQNESLDEKELEWLFNFLISNATVSLEVYLHQDSVPLSRLRKLIDSKTFIDLRELRKKLGLGEAFEVLDDVEELSQSSDVRSKLRKLRVLLSRDRLSIRQDTSKAPDIELSSDDVENFETDNDTSDNAAYNDAVAITTVELANKFLLEHNNILVLVTRSESMYRVLQQRLHYQESEDQAYFTPNEINREESFLRHPRIFADIFNNRKNDTKELKTFLSAVRAFIASAEKASSKVNDRDNLTIDSLQRNEGLQEQFKKIEQTWKSWIQAALVSQIDFNSKCIYLPLETLRINEKIILEFLRFSQDNEFIKNRLLERRLRLADLWRSAHQDLGFELQSFTHQDQNNFVIEPVFEDGGSGLQAQAAISSTTFYSLHFYSKEATDYLEKVKNKEKLEFLEIIESFGTNIHDLSLGASYERVLAMTFVLGILGEWELAGLYSQIAIDKAHHDRGYNVLDNTQKKLFVEPSEAHYFLAICIRKTSKSRNALLKAIGEVDEAIKLRQEAIVSAEKTIQPSPRYLHEKGLLILIINSKFGLQSVPFDENNGLNLLLQAENIALEKNNRKLGILILNNRLYYLTEKYEKILLKDKSKYGNMLIQVGDLAIRLEHLLSDIVSVDRGKWPLGVLDTIIYSRYLFSKQLDQQGISILQDRLENEKCSDDEKNEVKKHLRRMNELSLS